MLGCHCEGGGYLQEKLVAPPHAKLSWGHPPTYLLSPFSPGPLGGQVVMMSWLLLLLGHLGRVTLKDLSALLPGVSTGKVSGSLMSRTTRDPTAPWPFGGSNSLCQLQDPGRTPSLEYNTLPLHPPSSFFQQQKNKQKKKKQFSSELSLFSFPRGLFQNSFKSLPCSSRPLLTLPPTRKKGERWSLEERLHLPPSRTCTGRQCDGAGEDRLSGPSVELRVSTFLVKAMNTLPRKKRMYEILPSIPG